MWIVYGTNFGRFSRIHSVSYTKLFGCAWKEYEYMICLVFIIIIFYSERRLWQLFFYLRRKDFNLIIVWATQIIALWIDGVGRIWMIIKFRRAILAGNNECDSLNGVEEKARADNWFSMDYYSWYFREVRSFERYLNGFRCSACYFICNAWIPSAIFTIVKRWIKSVVWEVGTIITCSSNELSYKKRMLFFSLSLFVFFLCTYAYVSNCLLQS